MKRTLIFTATAAALLIPSTQASASPYRGEQTIRSLAYDVEYASKHLSQSAERYADHGDNREAEALDRLYEVHRSARHFRHELQRSHYWRGHLGRDLDRLRRAYREAHYSRQDLHGFRHVDRDFYRLSATMRSLEAAVGGWYRHYGYQPYRSYGSGIHITLGHRDYGHRNRGHYDRNRRDHKRRYDSHRGHRKNDRRYYQGKKHNGSHRGKGHYDKRDRHRRGSATGTRPSR